MSMVLVECRYVIMLEADCPVCEESYFFGTDEISDPMTCMECGCTFAMEAPDLGGESLVFEEI